MIQLYKKQAKTDKLMVHSFLTLWIYEFIIINIFIILQLKKKIVWITLHFDQRLYQKNTLVCFVLQIYSFTILEILNFIDYVKFIIVSNIYAYM